jgi:lipopolysaccharide/colanic/teichoic acid biosynthesis glycosyltransferase
MLLTVIAIKHEDGWQAPVFYKQVRVGLDGRTFNAIKFRTIRGPRVTRVGAVIRQTRIDELPVLLNVLRGEVSLILKNDRSPRPSAWRDLAIIAGLMLLGIVIGTR